MTEAGRGEHDAVTEAIETSGLTVTEVADRAGLDPAQLPRFPLNRVPLAVLARLADVVGLPLRRLMHRWGEDDPEEPDETSVVGAYLAEFKEGLTRDQLAEALGWTLLRVERALATLDVGLGQVGMRLAVHADGIVVVGRLDRMELESRLSLERLARGPLDPKLAFFVWEALRGISPERITDREAFDVADRLGLIWVWQNRVRVSQPVEYSLYPATHRHCSVPRY